jgi:hypothetical protein
MQVSLAQTGRRKSASGAEPAPAARLLASGGARIVLGARHVPGQAVEPIAAAADTLFGPRGAWLAAPGGPLLVCDTGHHRLLVWSAVPDADNAAADCVIGQPDFRSEGRNAKGEINATTLNVPTGIAVGSGVVAVADAWNHRVLIWQGVPDVSRRPADVVLGQADFSSGFANRGGAEARADTLSWCYGVSIHDGRLIVADTGNRRVLVWDGIPTVNGAPADLVLGQIDFTTRDDGAGGNAGALGMRWPHAVAAARGRILVADAGTNRVMIWNVLPDRNGVPCDAVLGQPDATGIDHNRAGYHPTAATMNMPYGVALLADRIVVADTANSRLLGFDADRLETSASATALAGQHGFEEKGDNRWSLPARDSVCWPYAVAACDSTLVVADSGNNRILLWETA